MHKKIFSILFLASFIICFSFKHIETAEFYWNIESDSVKDIINGTVLPQEALAELRRGNDRFLVGRLINLDFREQLKTIPSKQRPHSVILTCMDSRIIPEIIFDQGFGKILTIRTAGNVEGDNVIGSIEYAVDKLGAKLIVVMGHSHCSEITSAIKGDYKEEYSDILQQIKPAITSDPSNPNTIYETAKNHIRMTRKDIIKKSEFIKDKVNENQVEIVGAYYEIETGEVVFMEDN